MLIFLYFSEDVSETFTHSLSLDTFKVYMHLNLSFVIYAELLPLIKKNNYFIIFQDFNSCFIMTWSKKF